MASPDPQPACEHIHHHGVWLGPPQLPACLQGPDLPVLERDKPLPTSGASLQGDIGGPRLCLCLSGAPTGSLPHIEPAGVAVGHHMAVSGGGGNLTHPMAMADVRMGAPASSPRALLSALQGAPGSHPRTRGREASGGGRAGPRGRAGAAQARSGATTGRGQSSVPAWVSHCDCVLLSRCGPRAAANPGPLGVCPGQRARRQGQRCTCGEHRGFPGATRPERQLG